MATIHRHASGNVYFQFTGLDGRRSTFRPGRESAAWTADEARDFYRNFMALLETMRAGGMPSKSLAGWIEDQSAGIAERLIAAGLAQPAAVLGKLDKPDSLEPFIDAYLRDRDDVKDGTAVFYTHTKRNLVAFFGADRKLNTITAQDAKRFHRHLLREKADDGSGGVGLSENTARRRCTMASQFFKAAVDDEIITRNPFRGVGGKVKSNKARMYFVTRDEAAKVLAACPSLEWKLLFAMGRFGGLRVPSEPRGLRWSEVDWAGGKFLVRSPKTEHHVGGESRWVPIFPELYPLLRDAFEQPGAAEFVFSDAMRALTNPSTTLAKIVTRAGLKPWPKLLHNLRSTRQTELAKHYPLHLVCAWLGNKAAIAAEHYLQITDADFASAAASPTPDEPRETKTVRERFVQGVTEGVYDDHEIENPSEFAASSISGWAIRDSNP